MNEVLQKLILILAAITLFLAGCGPTAKYKTVKYIRNTEELTQAGVPGEDSIVFGRIKWIEAGKEKKVVAIPYLLKLENEAKITCQVSKEGDFVWSLEKGTYFMNVIEYRSWTGMQLFNPKVVFYVPESGKVYYIGTLRAEFEPKREPLYYLGLIQGEIRFSILNEVERDWAEFQNKFSIASTEFEKILMVQDPMLPDTIGTTESDLLLLDLLRYLSQPALYQ